jgi:D-glycero-D-manno-heptose 1,7-bisphosphate phosphatase
MAWPKTRAEPELLGMAPSSAVRLTPRTRAPRGQSQGCCYHIRVPHIPDSNPPRALRTVFLDRDGVLNRKLPEGRYISSPSLFQPLPGVPSAIARLNRAGIRVLVVTNQRGIALGHYTVADVNAIHAAFQNALKAHGAHVDAFYFCPHDKEQCNCRKPLPGLYKHAVKDFPDVSGQTSAMVGDSWSDIEFGRRLGMTTVFIDINPELQKPGAESAREMADLNAASLPEAVDTLLAHPTPAGDPQHASL